MVGFIIWLLILMATLFLAPSAAFYVLVGGLLWAIISFDDTENETITCIGDDGKYIEIPNPRYRKPT